MPFDLEYRRIPAHVISRIPSKSPYSTRNIQLFTWKARITCAPLPALSQLSAENFFEITGNLINQKKMLINTRLINDVIIFRQVSGKIIVVLCIQAWIIRTVHVLKICITIGGQALRNPANLGNCPNFGGDHKKNSDTSDRIHTLLFSTLWEYRTLQNVWTWIFSSV